MGGVYRELVPPERIVHTKRFGQEWTGGETEVTTLLSARDGRTTLNITVRYSSRAARDGALGTGREQGVAMSYDRLAALLDAES